MIHNQNKQTDLLPLSLLTLRTKTQDVGLVHTAQVYFTTYLYLCFLVFLKDVMSDFVELPEYGH